jgi:hypothetical protein
MTALHVGGGESQSGGHLADLSERRLEGGCRPPGPSGGRRRRLGVRPGDRHQPGGFGTAGRCRPGTPRAFCLSQSAPRSVCHGPRRSHPSLPPEARSGRPGSGARTRCGLQGGTSQACDHCIGRRGHHGVGPEEREYSDRLALGDIVRSITFGLVRVTDYSPTAIWR